VLLNEDELAGETRPRLLRPIVAFFDTSVRRESTCPVHFIWDGNGLGRPFVRVGFLMVLVGCGLLSAAVVWPTALSMGPGRLVVLAALATWGLGQALTKLRRR
jgi:hypothetical protein